MPPGGRPGWSPHELLNVRLDGTCPADPSSSLCARAACTQLKAGIEALGVRHPPTWMASGNVPFAQVFPLDGPSPLLPTQAAAHLPVASCPSCLWLDSIQSAHCCGGRPWARPAVGKSTQQFTVEGACRCHQESGKVPDTPPQKTRRHTQHITPHTSLGRPRPQAPKRHRNDCWARRTWICPLGPGSVGLR